MLMDTEWFIALVTERRPLWDQSIKHYFSPAQLRKLWQEIAYELDESCGVVKKKWRELRNNFREELSKMSTTRVSSKWVYFDSMMFYKDSIQICSNSSRPVSKKTSKNQRDKGKWTPEVETMYDPNDYFLLSLLPELKKALEELHACIGMQQVLLEELQHWKATSEDFWRFYSSSYSNSSSPSYSEEVTLMLSELNKLF